MISQIDQLAGPQYQERSTWVTATVLTARLFDPITASGPNFANYTWARVDPLSPDAQYWCAVNGDCFALASHAPTDLLTTQIALGLACTKASSVYVVVVPAAATLAAWQQWAATGTKCTERAPLRHPKRT